MKTKSMSLESLKAYISKSPNLKWVFYRGKSRTDAEDIKEGIFRIKESTAWTGDWIPTPKLPYDCIGHWNDKSQVMYIGKHSSRDLIFAGVDSKNRKRWKIPMEDVERIDVIPKSDKSIGLKKLIDRDPQNLTYWSPYTGNKIDFDAPTMTVVFNSNRKNNFENLTGDALMEVRREIWCRTSAYAKYRKHLLKYWQLKCALTGLDDEALLIASHIKPWAHCVGDTENDKTDPYNGLLLIAPIDKLFDRGYLSFDDEGVLLLHEDSTHSRYLSDETLSAFGLTRMIPVKLRKALNEKQTEHMEYHRKKIFNRQ